jgi:hypothetical protein
MSALSFRQRLVLHGYPKGPRRAELADTMLMAAADGRPRPPIREAINLLRHGMRARLGRPGSRRIVVLAVLVSIFAGFLGAAIVNWAGWMTAPPLPSNTKLAELQQQLAPGQPATWYSLSGSGSFRKNVAGIDEISLRTSSETKVLQDPDDVVAGMVERLTAAGWRITDAPGPDVPGVFGADHGELSLDVLIQNAAGPTGEATAMDAWLYRAEPRWVTAATAAGGLLGILLGWLLTGWASRRLEDRPGNDRLAGVACGVAIASLAPSLLFGVYAYLPVALGSATADITFWRLLDPTNVGNIPLLLPAALAIMGTLIVVLRRQRQSGTGRRDGIRA